ncbi:hypothetical protein FGG08_001128 [Glutinoglossum americanum]|uniref:PNPLA domain-containing protein n=1 Tax=Glutinoglossum americanum TaxID=1670608 RepID=A0A9P8IE33_9PEZI|nr:hypothetical protein FGG08_001128 [Glutinoglossum americanum]
MNVPSSANPVGCQSALKLLSVRPSKRGEHQPHCASFLVADSAGGVATLQNPGKAFAHPRFHRPSYHKPRVSLLFVIAHGTDKRKVGLNMAVEQKKHLRILTIDGGGYQGIASLFILDTLMKGIAEAPKGKQGPCQSTIKPCDVFDVIGGVGSGGWLAMLLGRFRLTVSECLYEYFNIVSAMTRRRPIPGTSTHSIHRTVYDMDNLVRHIDYLIDKYGTGKTLLGNGTSDADTCGPRCKHTFLVAPYKRRGDSGSGFCLFRTYESEALTTIDPASVSISDAFAAAGAKRGFLHPFKLRGSDGSTLKFGQEIIPEYFTNATTYALKEVREIYGINGVVPAVVNIGPGILNIRDVTKLDKMVERLPWGSNKSSPLISTKGRPNPTHSEPHGPTGGDRCSTPNPPLTPEESQKRSRWPGPLRRTLGHSRDGARIKRSWSVFEQIKTEKVNTEHEIREELNKFGGEAKYVRLGPETGPELTAYADLAVSQETQRLTKQYLSSEEAKSDMRQFEDLFPAGHKNFAGG